MPDYTITATSTGEDLGTYTASTEIETYAALWQDAGYAVDVVDDELRGSVETLRICNPADVMITEV